MSFMAEIVLSSHCRHVCLKGSSAKPSRTISFYQRYIRVVGTHNTVNKVFHLVALEVYYMQKPYALIEDIHGLCGQESFFADCRVFVVPTENIATIEGSAVVSEGVSRIRNALINGDFQSYDWDSGILPSESTERIYVVRLGYTCHQIGSGGIIIQLCQPYVVSSMR
jgi:BTB/POZ domain-containing protein 9